VVVSPGAEVTEEELREHVRARVAEFKYPRRVWFASALPRSATGKLLKRAITIPRDIATLRERAA
jgi:long-chain acyl-CoA synthetase